MIVDCSPYHIQKALCTGREPSLIKFDQSTMRIEFNKFIDRDLKDFSINEIFDNSSTHNSLMAAYFVQITPILN